MAPAIAIRHGRPGESGGPGQVLRPCCSWICAFGKRGPKGKRRTFLGSRFDFWTEERPRAGTEGLVPAPLDRLPLVVPAGAVVPMTAAVSDHDEPSWCVRVYPGPGSGESSFVIVEDDGVSTAGPVSEVRIQLSWTRSEVELGVDV
jgi:hypothetical protein